MTTSFLTNAAYAGYFITKNLAIGVAANFVTSKIFPTHKASQERASLSQEFMKIQFDYTSTDDEIKKIKGKIKIIDEKDAALTGKVSNLFKFVIRCLSLGFFCRNTEKSTLQDELARLNHHNKQIQEAASKIRQRDAELIGEIEKQTINKTFVTLFIMMVVVPNLPTLLEPLLELDEPSKRIVNGTDMIAILKENDPTQLAELTQRINTAWAGSSLHFDQFKETDKLCKVMHNLHPDQHLSFSKPVEWNGAYETLKNFCSKPLNIEI